MTEQTIPYDTTYQPPVNGTVPYIDNRVQIVVDSKKIETWELMVLESLKITDWLLVFSRYLCRNGQPVSPEIPNKPIDELSKAELAQIRNSDAFKMIKRYPVQELKAAAQSFIDQASTGF